MCITQPTYYTSVGFFFIEPSVNPSKAAIYM